MTAFVTGATGFIGSHLVELLIQKGFSVRALSRQSRPPRDLENSKMEWVRGDLQSQIPESFLKDTDYVFHLAALIDAPSRKDFFGVNVEGTRRLLEALKRSGAKLKKFIFVSSQAAGGPSFEARAVREDDPPHPVSFYGASKLAAEKILLESAKDFPLVILRPPTIYGPRERRVLRAFQMVKRGFMITAGLKPKWISFCYVSDLNNALLHAALKPNPHLIYNVAGERPCEWLEFVRAMGEAMNCPYRIFKVPKLPLFLLGIGGEIYTQLTQRPTLFTWQKVREFVQNSWVIDGRRIREELGWREETSLEEGMFRTVEWYRRARWL